MPKEIAVFGGGCFWCTEAVFKMLKGVIAVAPGYAGGHVVNPTYEQVSRGDTGHAEVIRIEYDPTMIAYEKLLTVFFATHDPTTKNRQGNDIGPQYRSAVFYATLEQKAAVEKYIAGLNASSEKGASIVTEVQPLDKFYEEENYHRDYFAKNPEQPYCQVVVAPKVEKARQKFAELLRDNSR